MVIRHKVLSEDEQNEQGRLWRDCKPAIYGAAYQGDMDGKFLAAMRQKYVLDDNTVAVRLWRKEIGEASDAGFPPAMVERGYRILDGDVWDYDVNEAMDWFRKAHEAGCLAGTGGMGATAALNDYSGREKPLMIEYLRQAADGGDPMGNLTLGNMYYYGDGLPLDYGQALEYYRRTAEAGGSNGYRYVARILIRGLAGPADLAGGRAALETSLGYGEDEEKLALLAELEELEAAAGR